MTMTQVVMARTNELLAEKNMTKSDLYKATNPSKATIESIYRGLATSITLNTLDGLCSALGVTMSEVLDSKYFKREEVTSEEPVA